MKRPTPKGWDRRFAIVREGVKALVILGYTVFAFILLIGQGSPLAFGPLLPWALWQRSSLRGD